MTKFVILEYGTGTGKVLGEYNTYEQAEVAMNQEADYVVCINDEDGTETWELEAAAWYSGDGFFKLNVTHVDKITALKMFAAAAFAQEKVESGEDAKTYHFNLHRSGDGAIFSIGGGTLKIGKQIVDDLQVEWDKWEAEGFPNPGANRVIAALEGSDIYANPVDGIGPTFYLDDGWEVFTS